MQATVSADGSIADVTWEVGVDWQGQGIGSAAAAAVVEWLIQQGVGVVRAMVHPGHAASAVVAARARPEPTSDIVDGEVVWRRSTG